MNLTVRVADGKELKVLGKGSIELTLSSGCKIELKRVYHIPGLDSNLLSVNDLTTIDLKVIFQRDQAKILDKDNNELMIIERGSDMVYVLQTSVNNCMAVRSSIVTINELHQRLSHTRAFIIRQMIKNNFFPNMKKSSMTRNLNALLANSAKRQRSHMLQ